MQRSACTLAGGVCLLVLLALRSVGAAESGRLDILEDVHGYNTGKAVVVPLRAFADWLGAAVQYDRRSLEVRLGSQEARLRVGSCTATVNGERVKLPTAPKLYGGAACVPLRPLCESLGIDVDYAPPDSEETGATAGTPFVVLTGEHRTGRVLVHEEPPDVVSRIVSDLGSAPQTDRADPEAESFSLGSYGQDWIVWVRKIKRGYFWSTWPPTWHEEGGADGQSYFRSLAIAVYGVRDGKWCVLLGMQDMPSREEWRQAGIPEGVARALGVSFR